MTSQISQYLKIYGPIVFKLYHNVLQLIRKQVPTCLKFGEPPVHLFTSGAAKEELAPPASSVMDSQETMAKRKALIGGPLTVRQCRGRSLMLKQRENIRGRVTMRKVK